MTVFLRDFMCLFLLFVTFWSVNCDDEIIPDVKLLAKRGRFFVYPLQTSEYFNRSVTVKWSASLHGRPDLPTWLYLAQSQQNSLAYLYGTPEPSDQNCDIEVLALNQNNFQVVRKIIYIHVRFDSRFTIPMSQVSELWVKNYDAWELLNKPTIMKDLQERVRKAFRGPGIRPYVRDIKPATSMGGRIPLTNHKTGFVAMVATRKEFNQVVQLFARGLKMNKDHCQRNEIVPFDRFFQPTFQVDWCRFTVRKATPGHVGEMQADRAAVLPPKSSDLAQQIPPALSYHNSGEEYTPYSRRKPKRSYLWDWVLVAAIPMAVLLVIILMLSMVFFGCREGQHWRDYKTPQAQLNEFMSVRRGQKLLNELDGKRQSVVILDDTPDDVILGLGADANSTRSAIIRESVPVESVSETRASSRAPVGKQTVLEAASARGSPSLHMYEEHERWVESWIEVALRESHEIGLLSDQTGTIKREPKKTHSLVTAV